MKKILMIVGSLRKASFNAQLAARVETLLSDRAEIEYLDFSALPFMDQDLEYPVPESVAKAREAVLNSDGLWIFSPEYNYSIPGGLKNLLDWLSRPVDPTNRQSPSALRGKKVTVSAAAGKSRAAGVRRSLEALLQIMSMELVGGMGTGVLLDTEAFQSGKLSLSAEEKEALANQAESFLALL